MRRKIKKNIKLTVTFCSNNEFKKHGTKHILSPYRTVLYNQDSASTRN